MKFEQQPQKSTEEQAALEKSREENYLNANREAFKKTQEGEVTFTNGVIEDAALAMNAEFDRAKAESKARDEIALSELRDKIEIGEKNDKKSQELTPEEKQKRRLEIYKQREDAVQQRDAVGKSPEQRQKSQETLDGLNKQLEEL